MVRAAIYCRVSTERQGAEDKTSLPAQQQICTAHCECRGYEVGSVFVERFTGEMLDRPVLEDALAAAAAGQFEVLVVSAADRLSRNEANATFLKLYAQRVLHIRLEIVEIETEKEKKAHQVKKKSQYDEADLLAETEERFSGFIAEIAKRMLVINMQKGKRRRVEMQGRLWPGAWPLYGYDWNNRETKDAYLLDPVSSVVVKRIFEEAAAGKSMLRVAKDLNAEGIPPPAEYAYRKGYLPSSRKRSQWWWASMLTRMIHTPAYWGEYVAFRREYTWVQKHDPVTGKNRFRQRVTLKAADDVSEVNRKFPAMAFIPADSRHPRGPPPSAGCWRCWAALAR